MARVSSPGLLQDHFVRLSKWFRAYRRRDQPAARPGMVRYGEIALDGDGINSPFASAFVKNLPTPGLEVRRLFDFVRDDVMEATGRKQKPFSYGSISGKQDFYFVAGK